MRDACSAGVDEPLARAVVYRTLSMGFQAPEDGRLRQMGARDGFPTVIAALRHLQDRAGSGSIVPVITRLRSMPVEEVEALANRFARLFGHTARGLVCPCETEYGPANAFYQPQQLADLSGYYLAFGLRPIAAAEVRVDHIACECEFMDFLSRKEAWLLASLAEPGRNPTARGQDEETLEVTRQAARTFLRDHLGRFGRAFASRLVSEDGDGYFGVLGRLLRAFVEVEAARMGVEVGPIDLVVRPETIDDTPMACGTADELIQIQRKP